MTGSSGGGHNAKMYRDVLVNIRDLHSALICEVQITLTGIAILKKSEQKIYSIMRMASGQELLETFVFSRQEDPGSSQDSGVPLKRSGSLSLTSSTVMVPSPAEPLTPLSPGSELRKRNGWGGIVPSQGTRATAPLSPSNKRYATCEGTEEELEPLSPL
jgi:hypothetical protein